MSGETPAKHADLKSELSSDIVTQHTGSGRQTHASTPDKKKLNINLCISSNVSSILDSKTEYIK